MLVALQDAREPLGTATGLLLEAHSPLMEAERRWEEEASRRVTARGVPASSSPPLP